MWWVETIQWPEAVLWTIRRWGMLCERLSAGELEKLEMYTHTRMHTEHPYHTHLNVSDVPTKANVLIHS
jgi:hypothetical protein